MSPGLNAYNRERWSRTKENLLPMSEYDRGKRMKFFSGLRASIAMADVDDSVGIYRLGQQATDLPAAKARV